MVVTESMACMNAKVKSSYHTHYHKSGRGKTFLQHILFCKMIMKNDNGILGGFEGGHIYGLRQLFICLVKAT